MPGLSNKMFLEMVMKHGQVLNNGIKGLIKLKREKI